MCAVKSETTFSITSSSHNPSATLSSLNSNRQDDASIKFLKVCTLIDVFENGEYTVSELLSIQNEYFHHVKI